MSDPSQRFSSLGPPPPGDEPEAQVAYLQGVLAAFEQTRHPRLKPLRRKLQRALKGLGSPQAQRDPARAAAQFARELQALRLQTFELVATLASQVRTALAAQHKGAPLPGDVHTVDLALEEFGRGMRKAVVALRRGDARAEDEARELLRGAGERVRRREASGAHDG